MYQLMNMWLMFVYYVLESFGIKVWIFFIDQRSEITKSVFLSTTLFYF